ncbi:hypothetical protein GCM10009654_09520 [Streptomyces hebeiensis]|uniref:Uncharacterized protein n=1 Tax=Streptomyces hebeiensis TaxID=229486 RepID=A0ABN1UMI5_9ACTN
MSTSAAIGDIFFIMINTKKVAIMTKPRIVSMGPLTFTLELPPGTAVRMTLGPVSAR